MSAVYGFGSNAHDNFGLGPDVVQVETPIKLKHPLLVQANWSQAMFSQQPLIHSSVSSSW